MSDWTLTLPILIPAVFAILTLLTAKNGRNARVALTLISSGASVVIAALLFGRNIAFNASWAGFGMDLSLKLYNFSAFILLALSCITFLAALYSAVFMKDKPSQRMYYSSMLFTLAFASGAALANNMILLIFFWGGMLAPLFAMIMTGGVKVGKTAVKALVLNGVADLCLILGAAVAVWLSGTLTIDKINLPLNTFWGNFSFIMMMIGATAKAGAMPFHTWIPDAAEVAPPPFMAFLPGAVEKFAGIYLLARLSLDMFQLKPGSSASMTMMILGSCVILFAVLMALIQKDYKRLLSYHAVSQVGYMILGIGTALPIGIVGGLFHMLNHAMYKSCLFLTSGSVERQTGTTDLRALGGLGRKMPVTFACFLVAALSISGVPPFNGFFSKELVFDAALESNVVFYIAAALGAFLTAASFLKLGHAAYFGKPTEAAEKVKKDAPWPMLAPMLILAAGCLLFGVYNPLPLHGLVEPVLGGRLETSVAGLPQNWVLPVVSVVVLALAVLNHWYGVKKSGKPIGAVDHIHYAPGLKSVYGWAEARLFDPYEIGMKLANGASVGLLAIDRAIDWFFMKLVAGAASLLSNSIRAAHTGKHWMYALWALGGGAVVALTFIITK